MFRITIDDLTFNDNFKKNILYVNVGPSTTVKQIKLAIYKYNVDRSPLSYRFVFDNQRLKDDTLMSEVGIKEGSILIISLIWRWTDEIIQSRFRDLVNKYGYQKATIMTADEFQVKPHPIQ